MIFLDAASSTAGDGRRPWRRGLPAECRQGYYDVDLQEASALATRTTTSAHQRTRRDHSTETAEDYVEAVAELIEERGACRVRDLAERFGVSHVTVIRIVQRLEREDLVSTEPYKPIELTAKGRRLANHCKERHDVVYRFLLAIGVSERQAAIDSEGIEHHVSPQTLARLRTIADGGKIP